MLNCQLLKPTASSAAPAAATSASRASIGSSPASATVRARKVRPTNWMTSPARMIALPPSSQARALSSKGATGDGSPGSPRSASVCTAAGGGSGNRSGRAGSGMVHGEGAGDGVTVAAAVAARSRGLRPASACAISKRSDDRSHLPMTEPRMPPVIAPNMEKSAMLQPMSAPTAIDHKIISSPPPASLSPNSSRSSSFGHPKRNERAALRIGWV